MEKNKVFFTKNAMQILSSIVLSCPPTFPREAGLQHEKVIMSLTQEKRNVSLEEIEKKLGRKVFIYKDIADYARGLKRNAIDENSVAGYFGGKKHIDKIIQDFKDAGADVFKEGGYLFQHVLKPVTFDVAKGKISGTYQNGKTTVKIKKLVMASKGESIQAGDKGLVHFSLIVPVSGSLAEIEKEILAEQNSHPVFKKITHELDGKVLDSELQCELAKTALARHSM